MIKYLQIGSFIDINQQNCLLNQLFLIVFQTSVEEVGVMADILVIAVRTCNRHTLVVENNIERLCICTELAALQIAPLVAYGAELALTSVLNHLDRLVKRLLVVYIK